MPGHRTRTGTLVRGVLALLGILAVLVAIPIALWTLGGNPLPTSLPPADQLWHMATTDTDGTLFLGTLKLLGWAGWLSLAVPLLIDVAASLLHLPKPHLPGLSWQQGRAAAMTGAVAAMVTVGAAGAATAAPATTAGPPAAAVATHTPAPTPTSGRPAPREVIVERGDTLYGIAQDELGNGDRYPELWEASKATTQPDGRHLHSPSRIYPGDRIVIPTITHPPAAPAPTPASPSGAGAATSTTPTHAAPPQAPATHTAPTPTKAPTTAATAAPLTHAATADTISRHPTGAFAPPTHAPTASTATPQPAASTADDDTRRVVFTTTGLSALAAAGLIAALRRRRDGYGRHRRPGKRTPTPTGPAALAEAQLRVAADPLSADHLDRALRTLAMHAREVGAPMPGLRAARISADALELYLTDADTALPTPFSSAPEDPGTWTLDRRHLDVLLSAADAATIPAPYPALVSLGVDEGEAHLLLNLEELGSLGITGDPTDCHEVLTALAIELITSTWTDDSRITLVGILPELAHALGSDRASYVDTVADILTALTYTSDITRQALTDRELHGPTQARVTGDVEDVWSPHVLLIGTQLATHEREQLEQILATVPRVAVATITTGMTPLGDWCVRVTRDGDDLTGVIDPADIGITLQHLPIDAYRAHLDLFDQADAEPVPGPAWTETLTDTLPVEDLPTHSELYPLEGDPEDDDLTAKAAAQSAYLPTSIPAWPSTGVLDSVVSLEDDDRAETHTRTKPTKATDPPAREQQDASQAGDLSQIITELTTALRRLEPDDAPTHDDHDLTASPAGTDDDTAPATDISVDEPASTLPASIDPTPQITVPALPDDAPIVRLLGPVAILNAPGTKPRSPARIAELVAYLALHPGRSVEAFNAAIFPGERADGGKLGEKRNGYMRQARTYLGENPDGHPYVGLVPAIGYALDPTTCVDWWLVRDMIGTDISTTASVMLEAALRLVDGQPLSGVDPSRYLWAMADQAEMINTIADIAHELATRALNAGDSRTADWAASKGLAVEPVSEALWRDKITAAYQSGNPTRLTTAIDQMHQHLDDVTGDLDDDTRDLIATVLAKQPTHVHA